MNTQTTTQALEVLKAKQAEAEAFSASCPQCGSTCAVHAEFKQATRQEPMEFLGFGAICMGECFNPIGGGAYFTPTTLQVKLSES